MTKSWKLVKWIPAPFLVRTTPKLEIRIVSQTLSTVVMGRWDEEWKRFMYHCHPGMHKTKYCVPGGVWFCLHVRFEQICSCLVSFLYFSENKVCLPCRCWPWVCFADQCGEWLGCTRLLVTFVDFGVLVTTWWGWEFQGVQLSKFSCWGEKGQEHNTCPAYLMYPHSQTLILPKSDKKSTSWF